VVDDDAFLFHVTLGDHNLLWHLGVLSAVYAAAWAVAGDGSAPPEVWDDADAAMQAVAEQTHYLPEQWRGQCASFGVRDEFLSMFKFKAALFAEEVLVVLSLPYLLMQSLPQAADAILAFIRDHTVDVEGIGSVCGFSLFDFERYGTTRSIR
jgi:autophagy-related protein 9